MPAKSFPQGQAKVAMVSEGYRSSDVGVRSKVMLISVAFGESQETAPTRTRQGSKDLEKL